MIIIGLAGIAIVAAAVFLLVQSASATDLMVTTSIGGEQDAVSNSTITTNNVSNTVLGSLFLIGEDESTSFTPINDTYSEISFVNNVTIMPPNATAITTINATEIGYAIANVQPNGVSLGQGQSLIVTEGDDGAEDESATTTFVAISRTNPNGVGSETLVVFFSTNSTGQLAFLDNMLAIGQFEFSSEGGTVRMWEWKGGSPLFENGANVLPSTWNETTIRKLEQQGQNIQ